MIIDKIENAKRYFSLSEGIKKALQFIQSNNLTTIEAGKHVIDGDNVFAIVSEYEPLELEYAVLEGHRRYIDVQYIISGCEQMGYMPLENQTPVEEYDEESDCILFEEDTPLVKMEAGMFAIFFPGDLHKPGVKHDDSGKVKKMVVKVKV